MYNAEARKQDVEILGNVLRELSSWKPVVVYDSLRAQIHYRGEIHRVLPFGTHAELHAQVQALAGPEYNLVTVE